MRVHLVDGTYELFRHYFAVPKAFDANGREVAAARGVVASLRGMVSGGATHVAVATDHVIESFRNGLWAGYKTGAGIEPDLYSQFPLGRSSRRPGKLACELVARGGSVIVVVPPEPVLHWRDAQTEHHHRQRQGEPGREGRR